MQTKTLLTLAIMLALPFGARAENISGAMYTAPATASNNHPAPTTQANAPYGRIDIDTTDQEHIATTAYVKGAYNSAIAAVNKVDSEKQAKLEMSGIEISSEVVEGDLMAGVVEDFILSGNDMSATGLENIESRLFPVTGLLQGFYAAFNIKKVPVYTTWGNDNAKTPVALANINDFN